jgi:GH35 family endo-1,4-beta-xylanase
MITELDVNDTDAQTANRDKIVADRYAEYLDLVGPFCSSITFEQVADTNNYMDTDPTMPKRPDGNTHRPNLWDSQFSKKPAAEAVLKVLDRLPKT